MAKGTTTVRIERNTHKRLVSMAESHAAQLSTMLEAALNHYAGLSPDRRQRDLIETRRRRAPKLQTA